MRASLFSIITVVAIMPWSGHAVKGVISDTITSNEQLCRSNCGLNDACLLALYQYKCRECWLMDCTLESVPEGLTGAGKATEGVQPTCDSGMVPEPRDDGCTGAPTTTTTTSGTTATDTSGAAGSTETGDDETDSPAWRASISWLPLCAIVAANVVVAAY
ncbi:hypothetical protein BGZ61DRAFT_459870 [Ilyonectria robusta]|uniref:uncharacterized protein n=1 Tax=Ilyonectria robusta TaxID=1079257 RepID=UPI001E8D48FB|nr:uncharacterized protein BGZ61DRAFT_459870 [Ilyonectria robusta]KAH8670751.1 hypothetical protein BGZ61DRAFT_459870 [Ilyonectria robusta]